MPGKMKVEREVIGRLAGVELLIVVMLAIGGVAPVEGQAATNSLMLTQATGNGEEKNPLVGEFFAHLTSSLGSTRQAVEVTDLSSEVYVMDLPSMGVHPIEGTPPRSYWPDGGAVGIGGAFMSISPDVISQSVTSGVGVVSSSWLPSETVAVSVNGGAATNVAASASGRIGIYLQRGAGL